MIMYSMHFLEMKHFKIINDLLNFVIPIRKTLQFIL